MEQSRRPYLQNAFYKFCRANGVKREFVNHYHFSPKKVHIVFIPGGYVRAFKIPADGRYYEFPANTVFEVLYKLLKFDLVPRNISYDLPPYSSFSKEKKKSYVKTKSTKASPAITPLPGIKGFNQGTLSTQNQGKKISAVSA